MSVLKPGTPVQWPSPVNVGVIVRGHIPDGRMHSIEHGLDDKAKDDPLAAEDQRVHYTVLFRDESGIVHHKHFTEEELTAMVDDKGAPTEDGAAIREALMPDLLAHLTPQAAPPHAHQGPKGSEPPAVHAVTGEDLPPQAEKGE